MVEVHGDIGERDRARVLLVIPTLGRRIGTLNQTLLSVSTQRANGTVAADLVVVTPPAAVEARRLAAKVGARIVDDPGGLGAAINAGLACASATHEYGNWLSDDDLLTPGSLETTIAALDAAPTAAGAFGHCDYIDELGARLFTGRAGRLAPWLMRWGPNLVPQPGALFRLDAVRAVGGVDPSLSYAMDLDLLLRLRKRGRLVDTQRTVAAFRWHDESTTVANRSLSLAEAEQVKRRHLPPALRPVAPLWEAPVRSASRLAAARVTAMARH